MPSGNGDKDARRGVKLQANWTRVAVLAVAGACALATLAFAQSPANASFRFHSRTPMGSETLLLLPAKVPFHMFLTLESPELQNAVLTRTAAGNHLLDSDGHEITQWPHEIVLRFTTSGRDHALYEGPLEVETPQTLDELQSTLHFRLKVFHGLAERELSPDSIQVLGVPLDTPSDERIYLLRFKLGELPIEDRLMFEVMNKDMKRIAKFGVQLN